MPYYYVTGDSLDLLKKRNKNYLPIYLITFLFLKKKTFEDFNLFILLYIMLNITILSMHCKLLLL